MAALEMLLIDYVCDTNVWYNIGDGVLDPAKLKNGANRLLATAINALEISSKLSERTIESRKRAAQAILDHADEVLVDPERHMADIWGLSVPPLSFDWREICRTIVQSKDIAEMNAGSQRIIAIDTSAAANWRQSFTEKFVDDVEEAIRMIHPKYAPDRQNGKMGYLKDTAEVASFRSILFSTEVIESQILLTRQRVSDHATTPPSPPLPDEVTAAKLQLMPFVLAYLHLIDRTATTSAIVPNDWGDLHHFVYLQPNRILVTAEEKWLSIARNASLDHLVRDSKIA